MSSLLRENKEYRWTVFVPLGLVLWGYISFTHTNNHIAWDLLLYMTYALNIFNGHGYVDMDGSLVFFRGPVFPAMIAVGYKLFGISAMSALGVVKLFSLLNPLAIYFLGRKIFSNRVAFAASLCLLTSYGISFWSFQFIDPIWPFFILLHILFLYLGFEQEKKYFFVIAGVFLAAAFLTKEVSILFFPLGLFIFIWIKEYHKRNNFIGVATAGCTTFLILLPWILYLYQHDALSSFLGTGGPEVLENMSVPAQGVDGVSIPVFFSSVFSAIKGYCAAFFYFYAGETNTVTAYFIIAPLFLAGWCCVFLKAFRGHKGCKILCLNLLLFSPIIFFIGKNHWRFGQVLFVMLISYLALAYSITCAVDWISSRFRMSAPTAQWGFICCVTVLLAMQIFGHARDDRGYTDFFRKTTLYSWLTGGNAEHVVTGLSNSYLANIVNRLEEVSSGDEPLLADSFLAARKIFILLEGKRRVFAAPMLWCRGNKVIRGHPPANSTEAAFYVHSNNLPLEPQYRLYLLFESQLIDLLKKQHIQYVVLSSLFRPLDEYFSLSPNYEEILHSGPPTEVDKSYSLYRVKGKIAYEGNLPLLYSDQVVLTLHKLKEKDPPKYKSIVKTFLYGIASLTENDVQALSDSILKIPLYHEELAKEYLEEGNVEMAITSYEEAIRLDPENGRTLKTLIELYHEKGMRDAEITMYAELNKLDPENAKNHHALGALYKKAGRPVAAIREYEQAVELRPDSWYYRQFLAELYVQTHQIDKAIAQYAKLVELRPGFGMYPRLLGDLYCQVGKYEDALVMYQAALSLEPEKAYYHSLVSKVYMDMGEPEKALKYAEEAVRLNPAKPAYKNLLLQLNKKIKMGR
ncbi:MAG TPA: tetratricopeptide repeat protein [Gammaproteobacteria bacterium]|nr:tetratricopeptide repeat protein [Gammaproteobacteria bacterium]